MHQKPKERHRDMSVGERIQWLFGDHDFDRVTKRRIFWVIGILFVAGFAADIVVGSAFNLKLKSLGLIGPASALLYLFVRGPAVFIAMTAILIPQLMKKERLIEEDRAWIIWVVGIAGVLFACWANWGAIEKVWASSKRENWIRQKDEVRGRRK